MTLTHEQKEKIEAILSIFETGKPLPAYGYVTNLQGDSGGLTYGKHQTTINSGNLYSLILEYTKSPTAAFSDDLRPYLKGLKEKDQSLNSNKTLHAILKKAGDDPDMKRIQDSFFDKVYWYPAYKWATDNGFTKPLSMAVIYDSFIHSGGIPSFLRNRFREVPPAKGGNEKVWIKRYLQVRHSWLANHSRPILRKTIYRTEALWGLINDGNWLLNSPFKVRGFTL